MLKPLNFSECLRQTCRQPKKIYMYIYIEYLHAPTVSQVPELPPKDMCLSPVPSISSRHRNPFTPPYFKIHFIHTSCYSYVKSLVYLSIIPSLQDQLRLWTEAVLIQRRSHPHRGRTQHSAPRSPRRRSASRLSKCWQRRRGRGLARPICAL